MSAKQDDTHVATIRRDETNLGDQLHQLRPAMVSQQSYYEPEVELVSQPGELPSFPTQHRSKNIMTANNPPRNMWRIIASMLWSFTNGFADAAPGALLPRIEAYYGTNYSVTSLIWISNAMGFILVACFSHKVQPWLGKQNSLAVGCFCSCIFYGLVSSGTKFPVIVTGFFFGGTGAAIILAQGNIFLSRLDKLTKYLSFYHASYGVGATVSPLIATSMVNAGVKWHFFYLVLLGMMVFNLFNMFLAFKGANEDLKLWDDDEHERLVESPTEEESDSIAMEELNADNLRRRISSQANTSNNSDMALALKSHVTWLMSFFILFYQGSEVALAGWIVTFLLDYRHGDPKKVGYVASGLWGGLTIGRLALTRPLHQLLGARRGVLVVSVGSIILVALTWAIPHVITEAVLVSLAGVLIGPNYPLMITYAALGGLFPRKIQVVSLTIMSAFGSSGGALFPFLVGLISQSAGTYVVLPIFIALYSTMILIWIAVPNMERRNKQPGAKLTWWERIW